MTVLILVVAILVIAAAGFFLGRARALTGVSGNIRQLHSLPGYYGWHAALMASLPALGVLLIWLIVQPMVIERSVGSLLPPETVSDPTAFKLAVTEVRRVAGGIEAAILAGVMTNDAASNLSNSSTDIRAVLASVGVALGSNVSDLTLQAAQLYRSMTATAALSRMIAVLLAASRAIGETMIVTMGAGAAAKLSLNPFDAMTTITVKIVGQLTGDTDFNSPETLVAFALGITLFVITLGLNVFALYIVRKYREQYE